MLAAGAAADAAAAAGKGSPVASVFGIVAGIGTPLGSAGADAALAGAAGRSSTLPPPLAARPAPALDISASARVLMKKTVAQAAVDRDRKLALPVAPNRLPDEPLPNDAPMSAPLPC